MPKAGQLEINFFPDHGGDCRQGAEQGNGDDQSGSQIVAAVRMQRLIDVLASGTLLWLFLNDRFDVEYVASYSSRAMPTLYKVTAFWGGLDGSLLFCRTLMV